MFIQNRSYNPSKNYTPKKPVKSFLDLEVYQKSLEANVFVCKEIIKTLKSRKGSLSGHKNTETQKTKKHENIKTEKVDNPIDDYESLVESSIARNMIQCAFSIPHLIAESHSKRFGQSDEPLKILDQVMLRCNKMVVYLEQTRDILDSGIDWERFDEQIKKYLYIRRKVLNLQRVWKKYMNQEL